MALTIISLVVTFAIVFVIWILITGAFGLNPLGPSPRPPQQRSSSGLSTAFNRLASAYDSSRPPAAAATEDPYEQYYRSYLYTRNPYYGTFTGFTAGRDLKGPAAGFTAGRDLLARTGRALLDRSASSGSYRERESLIAG